MVLGAIMFALIGLGTHGTPARAQSSPSDIFVDESEGQEDVIFESLTGFTGYGFTVGGFKLLGGELAGKSQVRPLLQGAFRYRFNESWQGVGEFGFGWSSFEAKGDTVMTTTFGTLGLLRSVTELLGADVRAGGGLGFYRWNYKFNGKSIRDDVTQRFYRGFVPGFYLGAEAERRLTQHVTATGSLQNHYIFTSSDKFQSLFDGNYDALTFRFGLNYHFSPYEGIIWERKETKRIRLESGKAGK